MNIFYEIVIFCNFSNIISFLIGVDPELDGMLAKLEMDEDFMKLSDNEQIAWLESLFFLDTPSKQASSGLVKPRPREETQPSRRPSTMPRYDFT